MTPISIERSWQTGNERADNLFFWRSFNIDEKDVLVESTDGLINGTLFEFKNAIPDLNVVLIQCIHYLSKIRNKGGIPIPTKLVLIDISKDKAYVYDATKYKTEIETTYSESASKNVKDITLKDATKPEAEFEFKVFQPAHPANKPLIELFHNHSYQKVDINFPNILGWSNFIYKHQKETTKSQMFNILRYPVGTLVENYLNPWSGQEDDFSNVMDTLNDPANRKDLGAFYTPHPYVREATSLLRTAIQRLPKEKDYVILDRCAGTGNLEEFLTEEELSHVILNTFEIKEWLVLYNKYAGRVRAIIPPLTHVQNQTGNLVTGGDALSHTFLTTQMETDGIHQTLQDVIDDKNVIILGFENPPYSSELARAQEGSTKGKPTYSDIRIQMSEEFTGDSGHAKDLLNQFVWSFEHYFMRTPYDHYLVFGPVKYWKSAGLMQKNFQNGFIANRGNFKATESALLVALWKNEDQKDLQEINVPALEIWNNGAKYKTGANSSAINIPDTATTQEVARVSITRVYKTLGEYYSKKLPTDQKADFATSYDGYEAPLKSYGSPVYSKDILAVIEASGFGLTAQDLRMTRAAIYHGRGSQVRTTNYTTQAALFAAKSYPQEKWYQRDIFYTTADKGLRYTENKDFLRKTVIFMCASQKNHCLSFTTSTGIQLQNELCLDPNALAYKEIVNDKILGQLDFKDQMLVGVFNELFNLVKNTQEYNSNLQYGTYQIEQDINTYYIDNNGKKIYNNEKVNTKLKELKRRLADYYTTEIGPKLFKYELLK